MKTSNNTLWLLIALLLFLQFQGTGGASSPGPREILVVHETLQDSPEHGGLWVALRKPDFDSWLKSKGHNIVIHDITDKAANGQPPPIFLKYGVKDTTPLPRAFVSDKKSGKVIREEPCPANKTDFQALIERGGG